MTPRLGHRPHQDSAGASWHNRSFFGLHFDLHARKGDAAIGRELTVEHLIREISKVKPDFVQCDCKGHFGYASYPTRIGMAAPGLAGDPLRIWRAAADRMGLPLVLHYSGLWDEACLVRHPDWGRMDAPGKALNSKVICPSSDYIDVYMIPQLLELIDGYRPEGFWIDGDNWACAPCYCDRCAPVFVRETGYAQLPVAEGEPGWQQWLRVSRGIFDGYVRRYVEAVAARAPGCSVCSNWLYTFRQPDPVVLPVTYLSGDFMNVWSAARAGLEARFMDGRGMDWDLMAWSFVNHEHLRDGDLKSLPALCQEAGVVLSCGGRLVVYDMTRRDGGLTAWHMDVLADLARFCRARQTYSLGTRSVPQVALLHSAEHYYRHNDPLYLFGKANREIEGCLHGFLEIGCHVDILQDQDLQARAVEYPLVVVPEQEALGAETVQMLSRYVRDGGTLLVSGAAAGRPLDTLLGVTEQEAETDDDPGHEVYVQADGGVFHARGRWRRVRAAGSQEWEPLLLSRDAGVDARPSGWPAVTVNTVGKGKAAAIHGPIFGYYSDVHYPRVRAFLKSLIRRLAPPGLMEVDAPSSVAVSLRRGSGWRALHLLNLACDHPLSPRNLYVESVPLSGAIRIRLPAEERPEAVFLVPSARPVRWSWSEGVFEARIEWIDIHEILVLQASAGGEPAVSGGAA